MYEPFTPRAMRIMELARQEARRLKHTHVGPEHILLGYVNEDAGVGANVLTNLGIDLRTVRLEVEQHLPSGTAASPRQLPQKPDAKKVMEYSMEEARRLKHEYVGSDHILLGLLRERESVAARVLADLGVTLKLARAETRSLSELPAHHIEESGRGPQRIVAIATVVFLAALAIIALLVVIRLVSH